MTMNRLREEKLPFKTKNAFCFKVFLLLSLIYCFVIDMNAAPLKIEQAGIVVNGQVLDEFDAELIGVTVLSQ